MKVTKTPLEGALVFEPKVFGDTRGYFMETWNHENYSNAGLNVTFVQSNLSKSSKGVLRGLHFQNPRPQGKLVQVIAGEVFDVAVDIRLGSPTFGQWHGEFLSAKNHKQFYIPEGFAHGFCVTSDEAVFSYLCTDFYHPASEQSLLWNDPTIKIDWPIAQPSLSEKDLKGTILEKIEASQLPQYNKV